MRLSAAILASAALFAVAASSNAPSNQSGTPDDDHRRSMGNPRSDDRTAGLALQGSTAPGFDQDRGPAESLYGPQALKRFLGLSPTYPAATSQRSFELGGRFLGFGDAHFAGGKYAAAYSRYKKAADAAPTLADAYFRQGFALIALGNYPQAAKVLKRGLEIAPDWPRSGFHVEDLYGINSGAKTAHVGAISQAVVDQPNDPDLPFVLGVLVHSDGEPDRAVPLFERAARLTVGSDAHLRAFLGVGPGAGRPGQP